MTSAGGEPRLITMTTHKSCKRYRVRVLEAVHPMLEPGGRIALTNTSTELANIVHRRHAGGVDVVLAAVADSYGAFGNLCVFGRNGARTASFAHASFAFKTQLVAFVDYGRTGDLPAPFAETAEMMRIRVAGIRSREETG